MKKSEEKVAKLLLNTQDWISSQDISNQLGYSVRSIKTYIKEINSINPESIQSSRNGYKANFEALSKVLNQPKRNVVDTQEERIILLLKKLVDSKRPLDINELCDFFFVSETTVRNDLQLAKKFAEKRDLTINSRKNNIQLSGNERNKRMLINDLLNSESADVVFSLDSLNSIYGSENIDSIRETVINTFFDFDYYTSDYLLNNIVLHIIIALERIQNNAQLEQTTPSIINDEKSLEISNKIFQLILISKDIKYSNTDVNDLAILISSSVNTVNFMHVDLLQLKKIVGDVDADLIQKIIDEIKVNYYINLDDANFKVRFSLHIKNLLSRLKNNMSVKNPMTKKIKRECPLIYDCAVNVSFIIEEETGFRLTDDEIAYLSFHLGYAIELYKENSLKVDCCLLSPVYYNMNKDILSRLDRLFVEDLNIQNVITDEKELDNINPELIISTIKLKKIPLVPVVTINPFISAKDRGNISKKIDKIKKKRGKSTLIDNLNSIISYNLFFIDQNIKDGKEAVRKLCAELERFDYCDKDYINFVFKREELSSTAFGKVAIPHSIKMIGKKTGMAILINPNGIKWGDGVVHIVLLLCIHPKDKKLFHELFDNIANVLTEELAVQNLIESKDYQDFTQKMLTYM